MNGPSQIGMQDNEAESLFARLSNAITRIDRAVSQTSTPDQSDVIASLKAENARLRADSQAAIADLDHILAQLEKGSN